MPLLSLSLTLCSFGKKSLLTRVEVDASCCGCLISARRDFGTSSRPPSPSPSTPSFPPPHAPNPSFVDHTNMAAPPSLQASLASLNLSSSDSPLTANQLRLQANALFPSSPASSIPLYTAALSLTPLSAPILANRSAAHLKCRNFVEAYRDAVQALDDKSEGAREVGGGQGERELRVKCVVRAGEACVGAEVWDLGVIVRIDRMEDGQSELGVGWA